MSNAAVLTDTTETRHEVDLTPDGGVRRPLPPYVTDASPRDLLDQLAAIASRAAHDGGNLPPDMADRLDDLADAARLHRPVIEHPAWCDRGDCDAQREENGSIAVFHNVTLFEAWPAAAQFGFAAGQPWRVQLVRCDNYLPDGDVEITEARLYVDDPSGDGFAGQLMQDVARAIALGAHLAAADMIPPAAMAPTREPRVYANPD